VCRYGEDGGTTASGGGGGGVGEWREEPATTAAPPSAFPADVEPRVISCSSWSWALFVVVGCRCCRYNKKKVKEIDREKERVR
jgi:hypothetical protein